MPNTQHYFDNGTGRDAYISCNNGGFRPGQDAQSSSSDLMTMFRKNRPCRIRLPGITPESRRYMASRQKQSSCRLAAPKKEFNGSMSDVHSSPGLKRNNSQTYLRTAKGMDVSRSRALSSSEKRGSSKNIHQRTHNQPQQMQYQPQ